MAAPKRFFAERIGGEMLLPAEQSRHAKNVLRLTDDNDVMIQVLAGADRTLVQEFSLAEFMEKYDISVDGRKGDVTISILLRASSVGVEIVDWDREEVDPGFDKE